MENPPAGRAGKTGKPAWPAGRYLKYAIGEIILVVIGILIALYINNLNTEKQDSITLNGYLNNISQNIKVDEVNLDRIAVYRDSSIIGSKYFMNIIEQENTLKEQYSIYFTEYFKYNPWLDKYFQSNKSGFEALKNSGYLSKIQQTTLESELYKYYRLVEQIENEEKYLNNFMEEMKYDIYKNNIVQPIKSIVNKGVGNIETDEDFDKLQSFFNYPSVVGSHSRNAGTSYLNELYNELLISAVNLQKEIENMTKG
ncbi:MAG: DUF6090 family protein [Eudoraea sp.]|uniref:DUF6090 family protein n=1 Tax=Eudoraea sp. TaxID=1979955 RepID=UPI003C706A53